jgi:N-acetylglucosaminyldiphosphoundecaprenol N-acetyl-beta-D-mannosaminyltransferase
MEDKRINVLGVGISALTIDSAWTAILTRLREGRQGYITVTGVHGVSECQKDPELRRIHNESSLTTPDGMPLVWMGRLQGVGPEKMSRVYGPDLMLDVMERGQTEGLRHYLFGGGDGVAELLREKLLSRFPAVKVVGTYSPPFRPLSEEEERSLVVELQHLRPHCLWVGLSTPKQERIMSHLLARYRVSPEHAAGEDIRLPAPLMMFGVGAAFDFHAGLIPQAPRWMQRVGLEWSFRLRCEPRRLWKRYLKNNPLFIARALLQLSGLRKYQISAEQANVNAE